MPTFPPLRPRRAARGAEASAILTQGELLTRLGVHARAEALMRARPDRAEVVQRQLARLIQPDQMGVLFKALALHAAGLIPPGFEEV